MNTDFTPALSTGSLLLVSLAAVALLLFLIMKVRLHAFLALVLVSLVTAVATGIPAGEVVPTMTEGFGSTLGSVALLVGLGAVLGRLLETSGGAKVLADRLLRLFGENRAPLALSVASLLFGFPIFFDAGFVVMLPVIFTVARRLGGSVLLYGLPAATAFSVMHIFVPPHPGPVAATGFLEADIGLVLLFGLAIAIPTWYLAGYLYGRIMGQRLVLPVPDILGTASEEDEADPPALWTILLLLLLPLALIFANTGLDALGVAGFVDPEAGWVLAARAVGQTPVALLITVLLAIYLLRVRRRRPGRETEGIVDSAFGPICSIILITGAGGMFGAVLRASGTGDALAESLEGLGMPVILAGFVIASALRIAQGSATVALTTAASIVQPVVATMTDLSSVQLAALVLALAAGSVIASHVNDSGFWLVGKFMGMDVKTTLKTWTVIQTLMAFIGFGFAYAIYLIA
ncbi:GntP family permease [Actinoalloteichus sp. AHMU CJ021]|uniref:Gluconate:H+ symporter, GntP family n=1 Tax=Actinoalloteichus caeruleus DSM 43889 TaxID=1120930 RepID=A0ABT1JLQ9_ACTCY|nr:GntP family permease [Actinoalloteichus caeruleus]AUS79204.1 GntP family permease [Actinoalloteichus sp. AHMU CJ021]MCP2333457.1 gluconate:H+ symporter, GntP family [Actinoalloteichus caeruleus DSM 43889]